MHRKTLGALARIVILAAALGWAAIAPSGAHAQVPGARVLLSQSIADSEALKLDFAGSYYCKAKVCSTNIAAVPGWSYSGGCTGCTASDKAGNVVSFANNVPRITDAGLLVEEARTNLVTYSRTVANWTKFNAAGTDLSTTAPDGSLTAFSFVDNATVGAHSISSPAIAVTSGGVYTASAYFKTLNRTLIEFRLSNTGLWSGGVNPGLTFNTVLGTTSNVTANIASSSVQRLPDGWFRVVFTTTPAITSANTTMDTILNTDGGSSSYGGDGTRGLYGWGTQVEAGAFPTSHIPTAGSAVTRAADVPFVTISGPVAGSIFAEVNNTNATAIGSNSQLVSLSDGGFNNRQSLFRSNNVADVAARVVVGGVATNPIVPTGTSGLGVHKAIMTFTPGRAIVAADGLLGTASAPTAIAATSILSIGVSEVLNSAFLNGSVRKVIVTSFVPTDARALQMTVP